MGTLLTNYLDHHFPGPGLVRFNEEHALPPPALHSAIHYGYSLAGPQHRMLQVSMAIRRFILCHVYRADAEIVMPAISITRAQFPQEVLHVLAENVAPGRHDWKRGASARQGPLLPLRIRISSGERCTGTVPRTSKGSFSLIFTAPVMSLEYTTTKPLLIPDSAAHSDTPPLMSIKGAHSVSIGRE